MNVGQRFGENLRRARRRVGISQEELGTRSSLHRTEIGLLERGERVPRIDTLIKVASALEIQPGELLVGIEWNLGATVTTDGSFAIAPAGDPRSN
ncbi:MAG TPA: helix-turn-helix transcriptional regulator [Solirubrobacterales bacterium]|nr:helix-turn-helix transcriptional regulator [Solirubrobacterales bacterium]